MRVGAIPRRAVAAGLLLATVLVVLSCGTARRGEPLRGALVLIDAREQRGQIAFMRRCQKCHPGGEAGLGPGINDKPVPSFMKRFQVRHGLGAMPSFPERVISDNELSDILEYLEALKAHKRS